MVGFLLFHFPAISFALNTVACIDYFCSSSEGDNCIEVYSTEVLLKSCPENYVCESYSQFKDYSENWQNVSCVAQSSSVDLCSTSTTGNIYTGLYCCKTTNCHTGSCINDRCVGRSIGSTCSSNEDCTSEAYCKDFTSTVQGICTKIQSNSACSTDIDCYVGYGCNQGSCTQLFSLDYNSKTSDKKFCKSDYATTGYCDAITVWSQGYQLNSPFECQIGYMCEYKSLIYGSILDQQLCVCSGNGDDVGYCGFNMNYERNHAENLYSGLKYTSSNCAGTNGRTDDVNIMYQCGSISRDQYNLWIELKNQYDYWTLYSSGAIDSCAEDLGFFETGSSTNLLLSAAFLLAEIFT
ncbi:unnamed protein product [Blepharisma stoltei]|uniref:Uncharacterized protein n=1 Tax=Blepharisma stoltei TaxID=1481888 RepID=A0AAU9JCM5_9CILI|nr:unnamed protein product [Blepharisma stoltei]